MPATITLLSRQSANAAIAISVTCSSGTLVEGSGCFNFRCSSNSIFPKFFSYIPLCMLGVLAVSE